MRKHPDDSPYALSMMLAGLVMASWETALRRMVMMAQGTCPLTEYERMAAEKVAAVHRSMVALATGQGQAAVLAPFVTCARANVRRLRRTA
jgi:hypothetical protein